MAAEQAPASQPTGCPVHKSRDAADTCPARSPQPAAAEADTNGAAQQAAPEQSERQKGQPQPQEPEPDAEAKPMKCPLGFGSDNTAKLDPLNCVLCRSLYHEVRL